MNAQALDKIKAFIKSLTGIEVIFPDYLNRSEEKKESELVDAYDILPSQCGAVAPIFKSIKLLINVSYFDYSKTGGKTGYKIFLNYHYEHHTGGNRYTASYMSTDGCETFQLY